MLLCLDIVIVVETIGSQHLFYLLVRTWGNLIDHRPWEGNLLFVLQIVEEGSRNESIVYPALCISEYTSLNLVAIVRAVVHRLNGQWQLTSLPALVKQGANLTHGKEWLQTAGEVGFIVAIAFLCDGERNHLERGVLEDLYKTIPVGELRIGLEGFSNRGNHLLLDGASRLEADEQREVVIRGVGLVDNFEIEGLGNNHTTIVLAGIEGIVQNSGWESTEDVSTTEVNPCWLLGGLLTNGLYIKLWKLVAFGFPFCGIILSANNIIEFHLLLFYFFTFNHRIRVACRGCLIRGRQWRGYPEPVRGRTYGPRGCSQNCGHDCSRRRYHQAHR